MSTTSEDTTAIARSPDVGLDAKGGSLWRRPTLATLTSREFWIGNYDYAALFSFRSKTLMFFGPNDSIPVLLAFILGLQHALAMVGGLVVPPLLFSGAAGAALPSAQQTYLVSACLIWCGLGTLLQVSRIPIGKGYYFGSGVLNVIGTSFAFVNTGLTYIGNEYSRPDGLCSFAADGVTKNPCPEAYGALLGTATVVALFAVVLSFTPPRYLGRLFPPLVTGSVLLLIGLSLMSSGITNWAGGSGCESGGLCPSADAPMAAQWGSPRLIGLGFLVWISIIICDLFGPPIMKNCSSMIGLLIGIIVGAACGYFDKSTIDSAPAITFLWTTTFKLSVAGELVLPFLAAYLVVISEGIGNIIATADSSGMDIESPRFPTHIQGGLLSDALWACLAGLATVPPSTTFSQNTSVIALSNNGSRWSGYVCGVILLIMGIFGKFGAVFVAMPASLIGGLTTFLFASVAVAGIRILARCHWTRRTRFIATASLSLGFASICKPEWFSNFFTTSSSNHALQGLLDAVTIVVEEAYLITMVIAIPLELLVPLGEDDIAAQAEHKALSTASRGDVDPILAAEKGHSPTDV
ncbi:nucleoside transporter [Gonapodya prolifera JEL478]|uniref:Nucleoside transporter n=1 Tax=Gonapodya prolifera (strain JEL478) TaxID=1344416 RepID=A0A139A293_GONPJ|nr:nucleoside transporter [Gonapodya prolifera JEL478]|eukprot:KXS10882.1 nucleoside transporter [Gonapodya prolifera JEL478]